MLLVLPLLAAGVAMAEQEEVLAAAAGTKPGFVKGDTVPVSCLNRTMYAKKPLAPSFPSVDQPEY